MNLKIMSNLLHVNYYLFFYYILVYFINIILIIILFHFSNLHKTTDDFLKMLYDSKLLVSKNSLSLLLYTLKKRGGGKFMPVIK